MLDESQEAAEDPADELPPELRPGGAIATAYAALGQEEPPPGVDAAVRRNAGTSLRERRQRPRPEREPIVEEPPPRGPAWLVPLREAADRLRAGLSRQRRSDPDEDETGVMPAPPPAPGRPRWLLPVAAALALILMVVLGLRLFGPGEPGADQTTRPAAGARTPRDRAAREAAAPVAAEAEDDAADGLPAPPPLMTDELAAALDDLERVIPLIPDRSTATAEVPVTDLPTPGQRSVSDADAGAELSDPAERALQEVLRLYDSADFFGAARALTDFQRRYPGHPVSQLLATGRGAGDEATEP